MRQRCVGIRPRKMLISRLERAQEDADTRRLTQLENLQTKQERKIEDHDADLLESNNEAARQILMSR